MRILMLTPYLPYPLLSGGQVRTYNLLKHISKEHEVTLFSLIKHENEREHIAHLQQYCQSVHVFKRTARPWHPRNILLAAFTPYPFVVTRNLVMSLKGAIKRELNSRDYDLIHVETFYMMPSIPKTSISTILVEQTIEYLGYEKFAQKLAKKLPGIQWLLNIDITKIKFWEKHYWKSADRLVTVSEDDRKFIQEVEPTIERIDVVSNGVDLNYFSKIKAKRQTDPTILFVGTFHWLPNVEAVEYLVTEVWPLIKEELPNARLRIVGSSPTKEILKFGQQDEAIEVTGRVEDIRLEYAKAWVLLAPVFSGKGTRYKVLEAMASETPVVGTSMALEGINAQVEEQVLQADEPQELASQTVRLLKDHDLQKKLGKAGHKFVSKNFNWDEIAKDLLEVYDKTT